MPTVKDDSGVHKVGFFSGYTFGAFCVMFALLMIITVGAELIIDDELHPHSKYYQLLISAILAGLGAGLVVEKMDIHLLDN